MSFEVKTKPAYNDEEKMQRRGTKEAESDKCAGR